MAYLLDSNVCIVSEFSQVHGLQIEDWQAVP
jgi:predicted nucleic acid-binding protein